MKKLIEKIKHLVRDEEGATMVEYAIMVALIAVVSIVIVQALGDHVSDTFDTASTNMNTAETAGPAAATSPAD